MRLRNPLLIAVQCLVLASSFSLTCQLLRFSALGQSATGTLSGTVEDETGALIPRAIVTAINTATTLQREATTGSAGNYTLRLWPPVTYIVRVQAQGFTPVENRNVVLNVGDQKALQIQLKAGNVNATVQVTDQEALISESPSVATVVNRQFVENM